MVKKKLIGHTSLSLTNAPIVRKKPNLEESNNFKLGILTKETAKLRTYRLRLETIEALEELKKEINKVVNIKISATSIIELLILEASKNDIKKVINMINNVNEHT